MSGASLRPTEVAARSGSSFEVVAVLARPALLASARDTVATARALRRAGAPGMTAAALATAATLRRMAGRSGRARKAARWPGRR